MASVLYQSIEALSRDKGIDPQIVVSAVEDAIALATRKYYKTQENMRAELDRESGEIRAYVYKTVVEAPEQLEDPVNQITLDDARALAPEVETGGEIRYYKPTDVLGRIAAHVHRNRHESDQEEDGQADSLKLFVFSKQRHQEYAQAHHGADRGKVIQQEV